MLKSTFLTLENVPLANFNQAVGACPSSLSVEMSVEKMTGIQAHEGALLSRRQLANQWHGHYKPRPCSQSHKLRNKTRSIFREIGLHHPSSPKLVYKISVCTRAINWQGTESYKFSVYKQASGNQLIIRIPVYSFKADI